MTYLGAAAGSTLGYIAGGARGAYIGYQLGRNFPNNRRMQTPRTSPNRRRSGRRTPSRSTSRGRSRQRRASVASRSSTISSLPSYRTRSSSSMRSRSTVRSAHTAGGSGAGNGDNVNTIRTAGATGRVKKSVTFKKPKKIVVSRKFRAQVNKALLPNAAVGRFRETDMQAIQKLSSAQGGQQAAFEIGTEGGAGILWSYFSPGEVINAASVLFNEKVNTRNSKLTTTLGLPDFGTNSFDPRILKVEVISSNARICFKNNQTRTIIMQLYECSPKSRQNIINFGGPLTQWNNFLGNEASGAQPAIINLGNVTQNTLYESPMESKPFRHNWNIEKHDIIMEPGQTYDHYMVGPTGMYDFQKFWKSDSSGTADEFQNIQPSKTRFLFATYRNDLVNTGVNEYGRLGDVTSGGLLIETTKRFVIKAPEQTGGTTTVLAANFQNDNKRDVYYAKNWATSTTAGDNRIDPTDGRDNL